MEINCKTKFRKLLFVFLLLNIITIQISNASISVPSNEVLTEFRAVDSEESIIGQIFFRFPVQYIWAYPTVSSNIIFIYVRPMGMAGTNNRENPAFKLSESISVQKDFSGIIDKIEYEGSLLDGGFIIIQLNGNYVHSVHQGDKFESVAVIIYKNTPSGSINSDKLDLIEEENKLNSELN
jgi:hypothetical protein